MHRRSVVPGQQLRPSIYTSAEGCISVPRTLTLPRGGDGPRSSNLELMNVRSHYPTAMSWAIPGQSPWRTTRRYAANSRYFRLDLVTRQLRALELAFLSVTFRLWNCAALERMGDDVYRGVWGFAMRMLSWFLTLYEITLRFWTFYGNVWDFWHFIKSSKIFYILRNMYNGWWGVYWVVWGLIMNFMQSSVIFGILWNLPRFLTSYGTSCEFSDILWNFKILGILYIYNSWW